MPIFSNQKHQVANAVPILVVESNAGEWLLIRAALAQCFPEVAPLWMNTEDQALTFLGNVSTDKAKQPALIIMDIDLPYRSESWSLLKSVKANPLYHHIPVICLSLSKEPTDIAQAYNLGAASYIVKPTSYHYWVTCFMGFRNYWWNLVKIPAHRAQTNVPSTQSAVKQPRPLI